MNTGFMSGLNVQWGLEIVNYKWAKAKVK